MLTCQQATQLLSERLDQPLPFNAQMNLQIHLLVCRSCRRYGKQVMTLSRLAKEFKQWDSER